MNRGRSRHHRARGFSLVEALIALAILTMVFTAIASAIGAGTASAGEARTRVVATLAADELLAEILATDWDRLGDWDGHSEASGDAVAPDGRSEPARRGMARHVLVHDETRLLEPSGIEVPGRTVVVEVRDRDGRVLSRLERFMADPSGGTT
ncbi:MAG: prepilin-type N-terminal cleavage/methylation domain-containing protein [Phycisphaerales bacterium]|nr:prepilin-type N-terminal cleavage/methylation domain-containing protein [Phycisphaerales bacterium]